MAGFILFASIYLAGQWLFFLKTERVRAVICNINERRGTNRYPGAVEIYYACFITKKGEEIFLEVGSNLGYGFGDSVTVVYKKTHPLKARLAGFRGEWAKPIIPFLIPFCIIMAVITAAWYERRYNKFYFRPFRIEYRSIF